MTGNSGRGDGNRRVRVCRVSVGVRTTFCEGSLVFGGFAFLPFSLGPRGKMMWSRASHAGDFGLWRVCFPPCLVRPGRRLPVQGLSEGSLGYRDRLPACQ